jgi:hypothetical protein
MVTAMDLPGWDNKRPSIPADQGIPTMSGLYNAKQQCNPLYNNTAERMRTWQNAKGSSEASHVVVPKDFTNVTDANCERRMSRHGALNTNHSHHVSSTERGDTVRSSACNTHSQSSTQHKNVFAQTYYNSSRPISTINQTQSLPPMLWDAETYPSWGFQCQPGWAAYQVADQGYGLNRDGAYSGRVNSFAPILQEYPPTPADTVKGEKISRKSSLASNKSQGSSPRACKLESGLNAAPLSAVTSAATERADAVEEEQDHGTLLTPVSEGAAVSQDPIAQHDNEQLLDKLDKIGIKQDEDCYNKSPVSALEDNIGLNFLSNSWDTSNLDFLDDANAFVPGFMADQADGWGSKEDELPSAYPSLPLDSMFSSGTGIGHSQFPANAVFASDLSLNARFDPRGGYEHSQHYTYDTTAFQDQPLDFDFNTSMFDPHPATTTTATSNDRTSNRSKSKDQLLVDLKRQGYSYKDIKVMGNFEEAESTLRGRYRTLTKPKEARLRKPEWGDREVGFAPYRFERLTLTLSRFSFCSKPWMLMPMRCTTTSIQRAGACQR